MALPTKLAPLVVGPADYNFMDPTGTLYAAPTAARTARGG